MAQPLTNMERLAADKRKRMGEIEAEYLRAKEYERSIQFEIDRMVALSKIRSILRQGLMEQAEALQMSGRVQQVLLDTFYFEDVVMEYDSLKRSLTEAFPK